MDIWNNWVLIAFVAPFLWALVNIIDVYFVDSVYEDEYDGAMISGIFQIVPWVLVPFGIVSFSFPGVQITVLAMLGGAAFLLAFFYYFRALFSMNDVALIQVLWNLSVPLVPFLAWLLIGERLDLVHYAAIALALLGAVLLSFEPGTRPENFRKTTGVMVVAVLFLSLAMVIEERAYALAGDFWSVFLLFSLGAAVTGVGLSLSDVKRSMERLRHIGGLSRKYFLVFLSAESMAFFGTLASQRAIDLSPSVSFIAVIESLVPAFVLVASLMLSFVFLKMNRELARKLYVSQLVGIRMKLVSIAIIAYSVYLIS